ncbi:MAG: LPS export ABC transporter periplasmic protein LptC [Alphaproteobacteria bacterium]|nr:LPS export ABC transporter periplasmic protein LptC [Alphaproteobacteria bacterium]
MKMLLPAVAVTLVALVVIWPRILPDRNQITLGGGRISLSDADTLRMSNPRFVGVDEHDRPYEIVAVSATRETESANQILLDTPQADMTTTEGGWISLSARRGVWHTDREVVDLTDGVELFHDAGHQVTTRTARINLADSVASSDSPTQGQSPGGTVEGEGFRLYDRGARILFTGRAKAVLNGTGADG